MTRRSPKALPPPTMQERATAAIAAHALRAALADRTTMGAASVAHVDLSRPRRGQWLTSWANLPGFLQVACSRDGTSYEHACLPGWTYTRDEVPAEMIPDLEALAEGGERPTEETSHAA